MPKKLTAAEKRASEREKKRQGRERHRLPTPLAKKKAVALRREGWSQPDIAAELGFKEGTLEQWRHRDAEHRAEWAAAGRGMDGDIVQRPFDAHFRERYLKHSTPPHMQKMMDVINSLEGGEWAGIWIPPGHAKSALVEDYVTYRVAMDPQVRIYYISKGLDRAQMSLDLIKERMTDPEGFPELLTEYGPFKSEGNDGKPWTNSHIKVARRKGGKEREHTIRSLGIRGHLTGSRADLIILDDVADVDNQSADEIEKQYEWIFKVANTRLVEGGKVIVIGTRMKEYDLYAKMMDQGYFEKKLILPCLLRDPGTDGPDDPGEFLWPDGPTPPEQLLKIREKDARFWELIYQQNPLPSEGAVFPMDSIEECFDKTRALSHIPSGTRIAVGIDPAVTGFTAGVVFAVDKRTGMRYLVDVWNEKGLTGDGGDHTAGLIQFIVSICEKYHAEVLCLEANSVFKLLSSSLDLRRQLHKLNVHLTTYQSGGHSGPNSDETAEDMAVAQLSSLFNKRLISIPYMHGYIANLKEFVNQFVRWRPGDKKLIRDIVKATQMAENAAKTLERRATNQDMKVNLPPSMPPYLRKRLKGGF